MYSVKDGLELEVGEMKVRSFKRRLTHNDLQQWSEKMLLTKKKELPVSQRKHQEYVSSIQVYIFTACSLK